MTDAPTPIPPQVEARFKALAAAVPGDRWNQLIAATSDRLLRRLALIELLEADPAKLQRARQLIGELLVEYTNVALTCVAAGEAGAGPVAP